MNLYPSDFDKAFAALEAAKKAKRASSLEVKPVSKSETKTPLNVAVAAPSSTTSPLFISLPTSPKVVETAPKIKSFESKPKAPPPTPLEPIVSPKQKTYDGDSIDTTLPPDGNFTALGFADAVEFAYFFEPSLKSKTARLYDWQRDILLEMSTAKSNAQHPHKHCVCACNGSGKDAYVIAIWAVYFAACKIKSRHIITSSSGVQLTSQTEAYIKALATHVNAYCSEFLGGPIFKINQRFIKCIASGSEIRLFATDEEGKAEGYHPIEPDTEMCITVNESKSVSPEIHRALRRCTGYNYWLDISSPGEPVGDFYKHFVKWPNKIQVSYKHCPHHSEAERLEDLEDLGEFNAYYRSKWLAEFTSIDSNAVISAELVERVRALSKVGSIDWVQRSRKRVGIDLAAGGDETVAYYTEGNRIKKRLGFKEKDTMLTADRIDLWLSSDLGLKKPTENETPDYDLFIDDGGVGRGTTDRLAVLGWTLRRVRNQSAAVDKKMYLNLGAQNWYKAKSIFEHNLFILDIDDEVLYKQLATRYCKQGGAQGKMALESKPEAKAHGRPSPDRADALVLALTGLGIDDFEATSKDEKKVVVKSTRLPNDPEVLKKHFDDKSYEESESQGREKYNFKKKTHGSISVMIGQLMNGTNRRN